jgi:PAS domain S-box-containing protein
MRAIREIFEKAALHLICNAIIKTGTRDPFALISPGLRQREEELQRAKRELETRVIESSRKLLLSEIKYRSLFGNIHAAVVVHGPDSRITMSNPMARKLLGLSEKQLLGKSAMDADWHFIREDGSVMPPEEYPANQVLLMGKLLRNAVIGIPRDSMKKDVWCLVNADPVLDEHGVFQQVVVTFVDITDLRQAEKEKRKLEDQLRHAQNQKSEALPEIAAHGGTETILVAEDDGPSRRITKDLLKTYGYSVLEATNGSEAVNTFIENTGRIDLLMLDVIMHGKNGKDALEEIKKICPDVKALFISGYEEDTVRRKMVLDSGVPLIRQPVKPAELLSKIREMLVCG